MENIYSPSYYRILCLDSNATPEQIKSAWRGMMKVFHEDVNQSDPEAKEKSQKINEAYGILSNSESRKKYDAKLNSYLQKEVLEKKRRQAEERAKAEARAKAKREAEERKKRIHIPKYESDGVGAVFALILILLILFGSKK